MNSHYAQAQTDNQSGTARVSATNSTECLADTRSVHEVTPQLGFNDYNGTEQTVAAISYSFSQCIGSSSDRWFVAASAAHAGEKNFRGDSVLVGGGVELHPFKKARQFAVTPELWIGREHFSNGAGNTIYSGGLTISDVIPLSFETRSILNKQVKIAKTQLEWLARADYTNRYSTDTRVPVGSRGTDSFNLFGAVGLDQALGSSRWRAKGTLGYQAISRGVIDGYASLGISFRKVNNAYTNYHTNFAVTFQAGDHGFKGVILGISQRF